MSGGKEDRVKSPQEAGGKTIWANVSAVKKTLIAFLISFFFIPPFSHLGDRARNMYLGLRVYVCYVRFIDFLCKLLYELYDGTSSLRVQNF